MPEQTVHKDDQAPEGLHPTPPEEQIFPLEEAMKAQSVLRSAARMPPERYPLPKIIGMLSPEIQALREMGRSDMEIATIISSGSYIRIEPDTLQRYYTAPADRAAAPDPNAH